MNTCIVCNKKEVAATVEFGKPVCLDCRQGSAAPKERKVINDPEIHNDALSPKNKQEYRTFCELIADEGDRYGKFWTVERRKGYLEQGTSFVVDIHEKNPDTIVLLDTSARPLGLFFLSIWKRLYPQEKTPQIKFMVGNRRHMFDFGPHEMKRIKTQASMIQKAFKHSAGQAFNDKTVLVIDEYGNTGDSLKKMKTILLASFPKIEKVLLGITSWDYNAYKTPDFADIMPPTLSKADPTFYGDVKERKYEIGWVIIKRTNHVTKGEKQLLYPEKDDVVVKRNNNQPAGVHTIGHRLNMVGKFETTDETSLQKADQAIHYCKEKNDIANLERAQKIKQAYISLQE